MLQLFQLLEKFYVSPLLGANHFTMPTSLTATQNFKLQCNCSSLFSTDGSKL